MTGPEHYSQAEQLLAEAQVPPGQRAKPGWRTADELVAAAQVHATLALAAATALIDEKPRSGSFDAWREWKQATGGAEYPEVTP